MGTLSSNSGSTKKCLQSYLNFFPQAQLKIVLCWLDLQQGHKSGVTLISYHELPVNELET